MNFAAFQTRLGKVSETSSSLQAAGRLACNALWESDPVANHASVVAERLLQAPGPVKELTRERYRSGAEFALLVTKSHYPAMDLKEVDDGITADVTDDEIPLLEDEVRPVAESLNNLAGQ